MRKEQDRDEPKTKVARSIASTSKDDAIERDTGTSIITTTSTSNEKLVTRKSNIAAVNPGGENKTAADKATVSVSSLAKADLMDLDIGQETTQPVLQFTGSRAEEQPRSRVMDVSSSFDKQIEALEKIGILSATQLSVLKSIQSQVHAREDAHRPKAPRQPIYTESELVSLRPRAAALKVAAGISRKLAKEQHAFLIGEHVYKTRFHPAASLTEDSKRLSISEKEPAKLKAMNVPNTEESKTNPFGLPPAKTKGKGPSLPAHLLNQTPATDHGAAARAQYSGNTENFPFIFDSKSVENVASTTRPTRRNMINQTGFIALAENHANSVAVGKEGEDPLLMARKRGL